MIAENILSSLTPDSVTAFFKGTGVLGGIALLIYMMIRYKVVRIVSVDSGTEWIRAAWGREQRVRFGKRRERLKRLTAGRHLMIRGIYDGWEISLREIPLVKESLAQPYKGCTLQFDRVTVGYQVIAPDTPKGDKMMLKSFLSVRNPDRDNQQSAALDDKVLAITLSGLGKALKTAEPDDFGLPVISKARWTKVVSRKLRKLHGVKLVSLEWTEPTWALGEQQFRAGKLIARALNPAVQEADYEDPDNVVVLATQTA